LTEKSLCSKEEKDREEREKRGTVRQLKTASFDHHNTSTKSPSYLVKEVKRVLDKNSFDYDQSGYLFVIHGPSHMMREFAKRTVTQEDREGEGEGEGESGLEGITRYFWFLGVK